MADGNEDSKILPFIRPNKRDSNRQDVPDADTFQAIIELNRRKETRLAANRERDNRQVMKSYKLKRDAK